MGVQIKILEDRVGKDEPEGRKVSPLDKQTSWKAC